MKTYYILRERDRYVYIKSSGKQKSFGRDFDARYDPVMFAYKCAKTAARRLEEMAKTDVGRPPIYAHGSMRIVDREELFEILEIEDWAFAYVNRLPEPADERRAQAKAVRQALRTEQMEARQRDAQSLKRFSMAAPSSARMRPVVLF